MREVLEPVANLLPLGGFATVPCAFYMSAPGSKTTFTSGWFRQLSKLVEELAKAPDFMPQGLSQVVKHPWLGPLVVHERYYLGQHGCCLIPYMVVHESYYQLLSWPV